MSAAPAAKTEQEQVEIEGGERKNVPVSPEHTEQLTIVNEPSAMIARTTGVTGDGGFVMTLRFTVEREDQCDFFSDRLNKALNPLQRYLSKIDAKQARTFKLGVSLAWTGQRYLVHQLNQEDDGLTFDAFVKTKPSVTLEGGVTKLRWTAEANVDEATMVALSRMQGRSDIIVTMSDLQQEIV